MVADSYRELVEQHRKALPVPRGSFDYLEARYRTLKFSRALEPYVRIEGNAYAVNI